MHQRHPATVAVALVALANLALSSVLGPTASAGAQWTITLVGLAIAAASLRISQPPGQAIAALAAALLVATRWPGIVWQLAMVIALALWALAARMRPSMAAAPRWRANGQIPLAATALVGGVTPGALVAWVVLAKPDLSDILASYVPDMPLAVLVAGAVGFALVNAFLEELIWRGVLYERLETLGGSWLAIVATSVSFGLAHAHGFPRGVIGVVLAGSWALLLGMLRRHGRGLAAPVLAHVVADATIAIIVLVQALR